MYNRADLFLDCCVTLQRCLTLLPSPTVPSPATQDLADQLPSISNLLNGIKLPTIPLVRFAEAWWGSCMWDLDGSAAA